LFLGYPGNLASFLLSTLIDPNLKNNHHA